MEEELREICSDILKVSEKILLKFPDLTENELFHKDLLILYKDLVISALNREIRDLTTYVNKKKKTQCNHGS